MILTYIMIAFILLRIIIALPAVFWSWIKRGISRIAVKSRAAANIFDGSYINTISFYMREFNKVPCVTYVANIDMDKVFECVSNGKAGQLIATYQKCYFNWQLERQEFDKTVFILQNQVIIQLTMGYVEILFPTDQFDYANRLVDM